MLYVKQKKTLEAAVVVYFVYIELFSRALHRARCNRTSFEREYLALLPLIRRITLGHSRQLPESTAGRRREGGNVVQCTGYSSSLDSVFLRGRNGLQQYSSSGSMARLVFLTY